MQQPQAGHLSYPSLWLGGPALNPQVTDVATKPFNRRCDQAARNEGGSKMDTTGQPSSAILPADCTSEHTASIIWLDTVSRCSANKPVAIPRENGFDSATTGRSTLELGRDSLALGASAAGHSDWELTRPLRTSSKEADEGRARSNQPPRLQSMPSEWDKREPNEIRLRNLSAEHTELKSHCLEEPFRNRLATRVSDVAALQQQSKGGATYHRRLFQTTMSCPRPGRALLETSQRLVENVNKLTSKTTEEHIELNRVGVLSQQVSVQIRPLVCNSPAGSLCGKLEVLVSLEKDCAGPSCEDETVLRETGKCHAIGSSNLVDGSSDRCMEDSKPGSLFSVWLSNAKSEVANSVCSKGSTNVKPHVKTVHRRVRRTRASDDYGKGASIPSQMPPPAGLQLTPVLKPRADAFASGVTNLSALHLPSPLSPIGTSRHGWTNANMGADVHRMHQNEAQESEEHPAGYVLSSKPENDSRASAKHALWRCDSLRGQMKKSPLGSGGTHTAARKSTPGVKRKSFGNPWQPSLLEVSPLELPSTPLLIGAVGYRQSSIAVQKRLKRLGPLFCSSRTLAIP